MKVIFLDIDGVITDMQKIREAFSIEGFPKEIMLLHQHKFMFSTYNLKR